VHPLRLLALALLCGCGADNPAMDSRQLIEQTLTPCGTDGDCAGEVIASGYNLFHHVRAICFSSRCAVVCQPEWRNCDGAAVTNGCERAGTSCD
jgi:hypothetical protein